MSSRLRGSRSAASMGCGCGSMRTSTSTHLTTRKWKTSWTTLPQLLRQRTHTKLASRSTFSERESFGTQSRRHISRLTITSARAWGLIRRLYYPRGVAVPPRSTTLYRRASARGHISRFFSPRNTPAGISFGLQSIGVGHVCLGSILRRTQPLPPLAAKKGSLE